MVSKRKKVERSYKQCRACRYIESDESEPFQTLFEGTLTPTLEFLTGLPVPSDTPNHFLCPNCKLMLEVIENFRFNCLEAALHFESVSLMSPSKIPLDFSFLLSFFQLEKNELFHKTFASEHGYVNPKTDQMGTAEYLEDSDAEDSLKVENMPIYDDLQETVDLTAEGHDVPQEYEVEVLDFDPNEYPVETLQESESYIIDNVALRPCKNNEPIWEKVYQIDLDSENVRKVRKRREQLAAVPQTYYCDFCPGKQFANKDVVRKHLYENHLQSRVECDFCGVQFQGKLRLLVHLQRHHMPDSERNTRPYACNLCSEVCIGYFAYQFHRRSAHRTKKVTCDDCGALLSTNSLLTHQRRMHPYSKVERIFSCQLCDKSFRFSQDLKVHMRVHGPVEKVRCIQCPLQFINVKRMKEHMKLVHSEGEAWECLICGKLFKWQVSFLYLSPWSPSRAKEFFFAFSEVPQTPHAGSQQSCATQGSSGVPICV